MREGLINSVSPEEAGGGWIQGGEGLAVWYRRTAFLDCDEREGKWVQSCAWCRPGGL